MHQIPDARTIRTTYENFVAECPWCREEIIFNRASDLNDCTPVDSREVSCLSPSCGKPFRVSGDSVGSVHEMLLFDCSELLHLKHYMNCILTLTQAYEVFFSLFLRAELLYKPYATDKERNIEYLNLLAEQLSNKVKKHTFGRMRALFLWQLVCGAKPRSLAEAEAAIKSLPKEPEEVDLGSIHEERLRKLVEAVKHTTIDEQRNRVVHKQAYRPTRAQAEAALNETRQVLFPLTLHLRLYDDLNSYVGRN